MPAEIIAHFIAHCHTNELVDLGGTYSRILTETN